MAIQKPNSRRLLNKDEEDERKASEKFFLPTLEELTAIEEKAKEDAAAAVSSQMADPMRNRNDLGRVAMQDAKREMLAEHENAVNEQKQKAEAAKAEYERLRFAPYSQVVPGLPSAKQTARETMLEEQSKYDKMRMTEPEYQKTHKANLGETAEIMTNSLAAGAIKSGGTFVDIASATGAGLKSVGKWLGGAGDDDSSMYKEFRKGFQERLVDGDSLYDEFDQYYQEMRKKQDEQFGTLNTFTGYIERAAHSFGEQALMFWTASMSSALFGGTKAFTAISSKADDLAKSGKKGMQMLGQALGKINAGSVGGATSMFITSSAQSTKEAILDMRQQNEEAAAYGMPKKYTDDEIMEKSALYGFLNGVSEVGLEYAIGGVTGAAGSIMPKGKVKNPFLTAVLSYLKGSAGEGFEESVQTLASTGLKQAVYDQTAEVDWREVLDSGIVGMLTGVGMGAPSFIRNTSVGASAMRDVTSTAKATKRVNTDAQAGIVASVSAAKAKAYGQMAEQVRLTDSENADTIASIYEWASARQQEIADAMADDTKRKKIIDENTKDTRAAIQRMRDTNPDFAETERTGLASGAKVEDIRMAGELSTALGKKIRFFREDAKNGTINNGEYHEDTGEIWINTRSKNVKAQIVAHELTHSIEKNDGYRQLVDLTMNKLEAEQKAKGKTLDDLYREKETLYADGGVRLASYDEITSELVAEYVEKRLLTDEKSIKSLVSENRTLGQRIREWFDSLLAKMGNASAKEREYIRQMRDMYARALDGETENNLKTEGVKHSFVGENAGIDKSKLAVAERMEAEGESKEAIRQKTGWFRSYDNKWRYEIDDSQAVWHLDTAEPDRKRLFAFGEKSYKLGDILEHDALYEAYPQLRDVEVYESPYASVDGYVVGRSTSAIALKKIDDRSMTKDMLLHELQHILQNIEGFATGASAAEYSDIPWGEKEWAALEKRNEAARKLYAVLRRHGESISKSEIENNQVYGYLDPNDSIISDHYIQLSTLADQNKRTKAIWDEYWEQVQILNRTTPQGQYHATAGEIEAYDTQARRRMTADERKAMRPNIDRDDAIVKFSVSKADGEAVRKNTPGVKDAEETAQINEEIERVDLNYDSESGTVYHSFSSLEDAFDYNKGEEEYRAARNEYAYALAKATGKTYAQAQQYLDDLFLIHDLIGDDRDRLDYVAAVDRSSWVGNVEYGGSIDFSTLCAKRRLFTGTFDAIQQALPDTVLNENDFLRIRELLVEKGLESPCSMCYVEGSRAKHGVYVERFLRDYLATDPEWRPQIADFTSTTRLEQTRIQHPEAYKAYTDAMNKLSQRKPKEASVRTDYKGEILRAFKNDGNVNAKNLMGGIRFNSFSDFEIIHAIDVMQVLTDMARVGLHGQSYTKQKEFAEAFGNTGLKINLSLVAKDVDSNGRLIFDEVNGMKEAEAMDIRERYSENVGTVIVVFNEAQLRAALADERIDFVLPFHRSQWKKSQYTMMGLPAETRDFTNIQNDRMKNPKTGRAKKVDGGNIMPNQYWDPSLDGRGNAQLYLDYINENDYIPKFDFLLTKQDGKWVLPEGAVGDGYFKLLIDFKMYDNDGNGAPQRPVTPDFNMPYITKMLEDYKGGHGSFPVANDIVDTFVREKQSGRVKHSVSREDASVTEAETDQTLQQTRNDIAADEARYRELSDTVMSNERFNAMTPDEQNAILDEMQSLRERIDRADQIMQDMSIEQDMGDDVPMPGDESDPLAGVSSAVETEVEELDIGSADYDGYKMSVPEVNEIPKSESDGATAKEQEAGTKKQFTREDAMERYEARKKKREERKTVAKAETAFKRLGYDIDGAIVDNYEDAQGIIEDNRLAAQAGYDVERYIEANNITPIVDTAAKMIATDAVKPTEAETGVSGQQLELAKELAELYKQRQEIMQNNIREQGKKNTNIVNDRLDQILGDYDWYSSPNKSRKFWRQQLQLSLSNPEQVIRDVFGEGAVADELNEYIIRPTIENSARARRQTNEQVKKLRSFNLNEGESGMTQIFAEYSNIEESGSKKAVMTEDRLRAVLMGPTLAEIENNVDAANKLAEDIATQEYGAHVDKDGEVKKSKERREFERSIVEKIRLTRAVNKKRAAERALREYKKQGGSNASWNAMEKGERSILIAQEEKAIVDESVTRITEAAAEMRVLLDDMYEAINQISVIHGAEPIQFRKGYMPHSHNQTEQLQKWFNDHMGGLNVTPVQDLPTDIAGKTADRKPNKRWFSHAQERTGPRTTWDALGNIEDYLRIANDTIYHMDDIRKMRVLERYIRGIYSVARGATGEEQRTRVRNDVMQRMHGTDDDLVFLGLKKPEQKQVSDEDMDLSQMTTFVTWLTNYTNDLAAKQIFNRDIESFAGRKVNNLANTLTSWSSRTMMQYNISSNLKQLSQLGTVSGDVGARISKDAAAMTLRSMQNLGNGTNELEQKYHISERSTFLAEKEAIEEATFASDKDLTEKQKTDRQRAKDIWDYAWSMTDTTMSRYAVYAYFMEGMQRGMDDTAALHYADTKARNILASRMKGSSPLIFQSKNPILRMFTLFQREPLAAWQDILKTMPREYNETKISKDEKTAKEQITKRITGRLLGAGIVNTVYATVLGLGTPAMFDILGEPLRALLDKLWKEITPDEEDDITFKEMAERYISTLGDEIADDIPFANVVSLISNTYAGTEFESRLALNAPDLTKVFEFIGLLVEGAWNGVQLLWSDDAEDIELLEELSSVKGQIPVSFLDMVMEIVGAAAPAGNQIRKSAKGLIAVLRSGEYTKDGKLKYEVGGVGDSIRAVLLGSSNTRAGQEWIASGFDSLSKTETEAYKALIGAGVSEKRARQYVERVAEAEKVADETQAQAEARMIDRMTGLNKQQKAELYYDMVATDNQRAAVDAAVGAGAKIDDAVETARAIRDSSKKLDRLTALQASDMDTDAREEMYLAMVATKVKDADGNVIGTEDDDLLEALYATGLDFDDFLDAKQMQSVLNANESLTANQRASRFLAWTASQGYTDAQAEAIGENFGFSSGFRVKSETYQKIVDSGVTAENAVKVTDALAGKTKTADKINAVWSTGLSGNQLDLAVKSVLSEKAYERYRIVVDANIPLEIYTWALLNADQDAEGEKGHGSVNNTERELILSQLALPRKDLSALWLALGGSEKSNPYSGNGGNKSGGIGVKIEMPKVEVPKIEMPKIELPKIGG